MVETKQEIENTKILNNLSKVNHLIAKFKAEMKILKMNAEGRAFLGQDEKCDE